VWAIAVPAPALVGKARALLRVSALTGDHHLSQRRTIVATKLKDVGTVQDALDERDKLPSLNIAQRIAAVMGEVDYVQKEKKQGMNYSIVSHDAVTAKVRPLLHKHGVIYYPRGLTVSQNGNRTEAVFTVRFENIDDRTDYIDVETFGYGVDPQDKGPGKAMSYGVKYALLKVLGLETGDDPDTVQDNRADYRPTTGEPKPKGPVKLDGPYTCPTQLMTAARQFVHTLNGMGDLAEFIAWSKTDDVKEFVKQLKRDLPDWWAGGESVPADFVPLEILVSQKKRDLEQIDGLKEPA
jgi:hypothetical protein